MRRRFATESVEISVSYRMHDCAGPCCYVVSMRIDSTGQRSVLESRHVTGEPLRLLDSVNELVRELALEHFLPLTEPF